MANLDKLKNLLTDVFLLEDNEYKLELKREDIGTWDSLGVVAMAVGIHDTFGYHMTPEEAIKISSVKDIIDLLETRDINFDE